MGKPVVEAAQQACFAASNRTIDIDGADSLLGHILTLGNRFFHLVGKVQESRVRANLEGVFFETKILEYIDSLINMI